VERELDEGQIEAVLQRLREHLQDAHSRTSNPQLPPSKPQS
jgi:hypothetical protein